MPLFGQKRIVEGRSGGLVSCLWGWACIGFSRKLGARDGQHTFGIFHACGLVKLLQHLGNVFAFVEVDGVPAVESFGNGSFFVNSGRLKHPFHLISARVFHGRRHGRRHALHLYIALGRGGQGLVGTLFQLYVDAAPYGKEVLINGNGARFGVWVFHLHAFLARCSEHQARDCTRTHIYNSFFHHYCFSFCFFSVLFSWMMRFKHAFYLLHPLLLTSCEDILFIKHADLHYWLSAVHVGKLTARDGQCKII